MLNCAATGKPKRLTKKIIKNNIFFLEYLKHAAFKDDHPGIDKMVKKMKAELKGKMKTKLQKTGLKKKK